MRIAVGLRAFTGWAVAVAVGESDGRAVAIGRGRLRLLPTGLPAEVYHAASRLGGGAEGLIRQAIEASQACTREELGSLVAGLGAHGETEAAGLVVKRGPPPEPPLHARMSHTGFHASEGEFYRHTLQTAALARGLRVAMFAEADLTPDFAAAALGLSPEEVLGGLGAMGAALGPPWTQRERPAALAAWLALSTGTQ